jgi:hypothetical protein
MVSKSGGTTKPTYTNDISNKSDLSIIIMYNNLNDFHEAYQLEFPFSNPETSSYRW